MGREEQVEERQVLESIFPDEITDISETEFRIAVKLDIDDEPGRGNDEDDEHRNSPTILFQIKYPELYPDVPPALTLSPTFSSSGQPLQHPHLSLPSDTPRLLSTLSPVIDDNLGMAMIFTLISTLKESAEQLIAERRAVQENAKEDEARKKEEEENRRFVGEKVTRESFMRWREKFRREMAEQEEKRRIEEESAAAGGAGGGKNVGGGGGGGGPGMGGRGKEEKKLTGRELWERGLVGKVEEEGSADVLEEEAKRDGETPESVKDGMDKLKIGSS